MPDINIPCPIDSCTFKTGDVTSETAVELLKLHAVTHQPAAPPHPQPPPAQINVKRPEHPEIDFGITESQSFFTDEWDIYKRPSGISGDDAKLELRAACFLELRRHLFDFIGQRKLSSCNEKGLLTYMQRVSVRGKKPAVHWQEFYSLSQSPNEPLQQYIAKLQAKATHYNFSTTCECTKTVSYAEAMVMDQMLVGLHDKDIQGEVLAKDSQLKTFNDRYDYIHAFEEGKRTRATLDLSHPSPMPTSTVAASRSQYQRQKHSALPPQLPPRPLVDALAVVTLLMAEAPTAPEPSTAHTGKQCHACNKRGHTQAVCRAKSAAAQTPAPSHNALAHMEDAIIGAYSSTWDSQILPPFVITLMVACPTWSGAVMRGVSNPGHPKNRRYSHSTSLSWVKLTLLAFPHTSESYPLRSNQIGMSATICPALAMHWCMVLELWSPTPFAQRSWMPYILPTRASLGWKHVLKPVCIGPTCRPALSTAVNSAHCAMP